MTSANKDLEPIAEALVQAWWPGARRDGSTYRAGDVEGNPGNSAVIFLSGPTGPRIFDNDGGVSMDFIDVAAHRTGRTTADIVLEFRKTGTISGVQVCAPAAGFQRPAVPELPPNQAICQHLTLGGPHSVLTLKDLDRMPAWAPCDPKLKKCVGDWRQSTDFGRGVHVARYGGPYTEPKSGRKLILRPWATRDEILAEIAARPDWVKRGVVPTFCLSGNAGTPHPSDVLFLDADVKEGDGPAAMRDAFMEPLIELGASVFGSSSGRGRHILGRVNPDAYGLPHLRGLPPGKPKRGLKIEIFPAGTLRQIVWRRDRWLSGPQGSDPLPLIPLGVVNKAARQAFGFIA